MTYYDRLVWYHDDGLSATSSRARFPASALEVLMRSFDFAGPMVFACSSPGRSLTFVGALDFTAPPGRIGLSNSLLRALNLQDLASPPADGDDILVLRAVSLPHATNITLQPLSSDFFTIPNAGALLQSVIPRDHVALAAGQTFDAQTADGDEQQFLVLAVEPDSPQHAVQVINTNVRVTFEAPPPSLATLTDLQFDKEAMEVKVPSDGWARMSVALPADVDLTSHDVTLYVEPSPSADASVGVDVFLSPSALHARPDAVRHTWALFSDAAKSIELTQHSATWGTDLQTLSRMQSSPIPCAVSIRSSVPGRATSCTVRVCAAPTTREQKVQEASAAATARGSLHLPALMSASPLSQPADSRQCTNCNSWVPSSTFTMHTAVCARNNVRCAHTGCGALLQKVRAGEHVHCSASGCERFMPGALLPTHTRIWHTHISCPFSCGLRATLDSMHEHVTRTCPARPIQCRYCGDTVSGMGPAPDALDRARGLTAHEGLCGSRTRTCSLCSPARAVMRKSWQDHLAATHLDLLTLHCGHATSLSSSHSLPWTVVAGPGIDLPGRTWACPACTVVQPLIRSGCEVCGGPRPDILDGLGPDDEPWRSRRTRIRAPASEKDEVDGKCLGVDEQEVEEEEEVLGAALSPIPEAGHPVVVPRTNTDSGGYGGTDWQGGTGTGNAGPVSGPVLPASRPCANAACGRRAERAGPASALALCSRCATAFAYPILDGMSHEDGDGDTPNNEGAVRGLSGTLEILRRAYAAQVRHGCGRADRCNNPACASASGWWSRGPGQGLVARVSSLDAGKTNIGCFLPVGMSSLSMEQSLVEDVVRVLVLEAEAGVLNFLLAGGNRAMSRPFHVCVESNPDLAPAALCLPQNLATALAAATALQGTGPSGPSSTRASPVLAGAGGQVPLPLALGVPAPLSLGQHVGKGRPVGRAGAASRIARADFG